MAVQKKVKKKQKFDLTKLKGVKMNLPKGVLSFPRLFKPEAYEGKGKPAYSMVCLWDEDVDLKPVRIAVLKAKKEAFGPDKEKWPKDISVAFRNGDDKEDIEGYAGMTYVTLKTYSKPLVVGPDKEKITDESEIYAGCLVVANAVIKATESAGKYYISFYLQGVMKVGDGSPLGGGASVSDFDDVEVDEEVDDGDDEDDSDDSDDDDSEDEDDEDDSDDDDED